MADGKTPEGTGSTLSTDQQNLVNTILSAEFCTLASGYITDMQSLFTGKPSVPAAPTANDIVSLAGNLNAVIPAGFLLLHNDLTGGEEGKKGSGSSDSGFSLSSFIGPMLAVVGGAVIGTGIIKGLFGGFSSKTENKTQQLVDDLNDRLSADELAKDPEVLAAQKKGFVAYLKTYYYQQAASMAVSGTIEAIGEGMGKAVGGFFTSLIDKVKGEEKTPNKLQECVNVIMDNVNPQDYVGDAEVDTAVRNGIIGYLKTYMVSQTAAMTLDTTLSSVGEAAGNMVHGFLTNLLGIGPKEAVYQRIQDIVDTLIDSFSAEEASKDQDVQSAVKDGITGYITSYFKTQADAMKTDTTVSNIASQAGNFVQSFVGSFFPKFLQKESASDHLTNIAETLITSTTYDEVKSWAETDVALKNGVSSYVQAYFNAQAEASIDGSVKNSLATSAGESVRNFFTGIFGKEVSDTGIDHIKNIADAMFGSIDYEEVMSWEGMDSLLHTTVSDYIKTYFSTQTKAATAGDVATSILSIAGQSIHSFFAGLFGKSADDPSQKGINTLKAIGDSLFESIEAEEVLGWDEIEDTRKEAVKSFILSYFQIQSDAAIETAKTNSEVKEGVKDKISKWWSGSNNDNNKTVQTLLDIVSKLDDRLDASKIASDSSIQNQQSSSIKKFVSSYYDSIVENAFSTSSITEYASSSAYRSLKKQRVQDITEHLLDATVNSLNTEIEENKVTFKMDTSATIKQDENSDKMVTTLDKISSLLDELNTFIQTQKQESGNNVTVVNNAGSAMQDNLSVVIPG